MMNRENILKGMKYIIVAAVVVYVAVLLLSTGGSSKSFDTIAGAVETSVNTETLSKAESRELKRYYGLNSADYDGVLLYVSQSSVSAEEILLIKVRSEGQKPSVQEAIRDRAQSRRTAFDGYAEEQVRLVDDSITVIRGDYIFFVISPDASEYKETFTKSL